MDSIKNVISELNRKHLTPVAIILVIAAIGLPVVMRKKDDSAPTQVVTNSAIATPTPGEASQPPEEIDVKKVVGATKVLGKHDPFVPKETVSKPGDGPSSSSSGAVSGAGGVTEPIGATGSGGSSGSTGGGSAPSGTGSQPTPSGTPVATTPGISSPDEPATKHLTSSDLDHLERVATVRFGLKDHEQELMRDMTAVEPLPEATNPVVSFIGISQHSDSAVFLLAPGVVQQGEGTCMPSPENCQLLYLRTDSEHNQHTLIVDLEHIYKLKLEDIDAVASDGRLSAKGALAPKKSKTKN